MGRRLTRACVVWGLIVTVVVLGGCGKSSQSSGVTDLRYPVVHKKLASSYWKRHDVPDLRRHGYRRVAIVDFSVEFITAKARGTLHTGGEESQAEAADHWFEYGDELRAQVVHDCYAMLIVELVSRGLDIVPAGTITASEAYRRFDTTDTAAAGYLEETGVLVSDTGRITGRRIQPANGLRLITGAQDAEIEDVELDLLDELDADVSIRVRVRAGVHGGRATLERGSIVWVLSRDLAGDLTATRSLLSDEPVIDETPLTLPQGDAYRVDPDAYREAMRCLFPPFAAMAFESRPRR